jgi:hypothetical protein
LKRARIALDVNFTGNRTTPPCIWPFTSSFSTLKRLDVP